MRVGRKAARRTDGDGARPVKAGAVKVAGGKAAATHVGAGQRRNADRAARPGRQRAATPSGRQRAATPPRRPHEPRGARPGPQSVPTTRPVDRPARAKTTSQAKARAKARKAKAPKAIRLPLRERLLARLAGVDLRPRTLLAKIPFVVLVIGSLAIGLGITLWLSTDSAQRSYQLSSARALNDALMQQKEALERDVLEAESAPALADAARNLGMIPSRDTAHLIQDPAGNWVVVGKPKPAEGAPPPPLNTKLPDEKPVPPPPPAPAPGARAEVPVVLPPPPNPFSAHAAEGAVLPGPALAPGVVDSAPGGLVLAPVAPAVQLPAVPPPAAPLPAVQLPAAPPPAVPLPAVPPAPAGVAQ